MSFFSAAFCIFQGVTWRGVVVFHIFKLRKQLFAYEEKICLSEQKFPNIMKLPIFVCVGNPINKNRVVVV